MTEAKQLGAEGRDGLNRLYRQYASWLGRRLRARVGAEAAADVVQETYIRAAPYAVADIRHPKAFLLRIAMNLLRDESRREARTKRQTEAAPPPQTEAADQFDHVLGAGTIQKDLATVNARPAPNDLNKAVLILARPAHPSMARPAPTAACTPAPRRSPPRTRRSP